MAVKAAGSVTVASITDVASTTRYYLLQSSTLTAPAKPTASPPGGSWVATEPTYAEGSTNSLYTCDETVFSDGTFAYSSVSLSTSYEAAKAAYNKAVAAAQTAAALSKLIRETEDGVDVGKSANGATYADGTSVTRQGTDGTFSILKALAGVLTTVASFGENLIELGKNSTSAVIKLCGGLASIAARTWTYGTTTYTGITTKSPDGVSMECDSSWEAEPTRVAVEETSPSGEAGGCVYLEGRWLFPKDPSITNADAGYEAHMSSLLALVAGADTHIKAGVDVATLAKRITTAIQPVVLYNGGAALDYDVAPGAGTAGTVTLSETAENFKELTLYLTDNNGRYAGAFPLAPLPGHAPLSVGQTCDVFGFEAADSVNTSTFIRRTRYTLSTGYALVPSNGGYVQLCGGGIVYSADGVNYLKIYRVTGRR